ncbi:GNAT family N-acetyltransferase [Polymorphospora sp. NPDC051019]|uniref:GNAT family N-acetyltransferase n=1 Tax=Polymorphospora sp. NPDC051019 TaxID=3155725 RepID=UPI00342744A3
MQIRMLDTELIPQVMAVMAKGVPFIRVRTESDYWLYATLFASTCPVALAEGEVVGAVIAMRSQETPQDVYIQDVITHPHLRRQGVAGMLIASLTERAAAWGCQRVWLTSEPDNDAAHASWIALGFRNRPGDRTEHGVEVVNDFKGPGKDRAVYQLDI